MKTFVVAFLAGFFLLVLVLLIILFSSVYYLKLRLSWNKENLEKLPISDEVADLISRIEAFSDIKDVSKSEKKQMRRLLLDSSKFLTKQVPCYYEYGEVPDIIIRTAEDSKCHICNASSCVFHGVFHA